MSTSMQQPSIGFYVHYHGLGHKHRTEAILRYLKIPATVITSRIADMHWEGISLQEVRSIECDIDEVSEAGLDHANDVEALHYAPLWCSNITKRVAAYTQWLSKSQPDVMIIDVSAEISMLTRLSSIPQIVIRQHGDRRDPAHNAAYSAAHSLLAPFPESMEDDLTPDWVKEKTVYLDGFCRQPHASEPSAEIPTLDASAMTTNKLPSKLRIAIMFGRGGTADRHQQIRDAANSLPEYEWLVIGKADNEDSIKTPGNLSFLGWVDRPEPMIQSADIVVTSAGHNSVMELGRAKCKIIAIAEERPFEEQVRKADILNREGLAVGLCDWPEVTEWPALIQSAQEIDVSRWKAIFINDGAEQAARHIERVAKWSFEKKIKARESYASGEANQMDNSVVQASSQETNDTLGDACRSV